MTDHISWHNGVCSRCGYIPKIGNRRTPDSRRNWLAYCRERHEAKHRNEALITPQHAVQIPEKPE